MRTKYHNSFFILLEALAVMSLHASNMQQQSIYNDKDISLEKCIKHLDQLQSHLDINTLRSRKISTLEDCSDTIEDIFNHIPSPMYPRQLMFFDRRSDGAHKYSKEYGIPAVDGNNSHNSRNRRSSAAFQSLDEDMYSKYAHPKMNQKIAGKLAAIGRTLSNELVSRDGLDSSDISSRPDYLRPVDFNDRALNIDLKPGERFLGRLSQLLNQRKIYNAIHIPKEKLDDAQRDIADANDEDSWAYMSLPAKRASGNWLNVVSSEVAKRRRQPLSINNALMALTDMVIEHGREKQMRNRDNLRYHMFIQG